jgi:molybdenum cofactor cytidylyltransferase
VTVAAIVLAAGGASRFGDGAKLLAAFRGRPLVTWAIAAAASAGLDELIVVQGATDLGDVVGEDATLIDNEDWSSGLATSLGVALDYCGRQGHRAVVVGLGDQPLVPAEAWRRVAAETATPIAVATYDGRPRNPVRLDGVVWPLLPSSGDEGARALMRSRPELVTEVPCPGDPTDIDTVEDLARWS